MEGRKAILSFSLSHKAGVLGDVLKVIAENGANILTITQNLPISSRAHVVVTLDISHMTSELDELIRAINDVNGASGVKRISVE